MNRHLKNLLDGMSNLLPGYQAKPVRQLRPVLTGANATEALAANFAQVGKDMEYAINDFERSERLRIRTVR